LQLGYDADTCDKEGIGPGTQLAEEHLEILAAIRRIALHRLRRQRKVDVDGSGGCLSRRMKRARNCTCKTLVHNSTAMGRRTALSATITLSCFIANDKHDGDHASSWQEHGSTLAGPFNIGRQEVLGQMDLPALRYPGSVS
jgi:hypothetical protein